MLKTTSEQDAYCCYLKKHLIPLKGFAERGGYHSGELGGLLFEVPSDEWIKHNYRAMYGDTPNAVYVVQVDDDSENGIIAPTAYEGFKTVINDDRYLIKKVKV